MIEEWLIEFQNKENQLILTEMAKKYSLSKEEYVHFINLMMYYYIIHTTPNTLEIVPVVLNKIKEHAKEVEKHQTHTLFKDCISIFLQMEQQKNGNLEKITEFLKKGFVFHSFNPAFLEQINQKGLIVKEKPWDLEEVEEVRKIFGNKIHRNVFGLYQGRELTPVFFANNLLSSAYYGLSSPTFFRKFIENKPMYMDVFLKRDYPKALESIESLSSSLESHEKERVMNFFHKYWNFFASEEFPYMAITTKEKLGIKDTALERLPEEDEKDYVLRRILNVKNEMISVDISREKLEIFSYQTFSIKSHTNEKNYS